MMSDISGSSAEFNADEDITDLEACGFKLIQKRGGFRFGTDSVLLAYFALIRRGDLCVDLGAGAGAIATLLLAHNPTISVDCVEIQPDIAEIAERNARMNGIADKMRVYNIDMRNAGAVLGSGRYACAVCNPPYFKAGGALLNPDENRRVSRHEGELTPSEICASAARLLKFGGRLSVIYPASRLHEMLRAMEDNKIAPKRLRTVHGVENRAPKHFLLDGVKGGGSGLEWLPPLALMRENGEPTEEWHKIYGH